MRSERGEGPMMPWRGKVMMVRQGKANADADADGQTRANYYDMVVMTIVMLCLFLPSLSSLSDLRFDLGFGVERFESRRASKSRLLLLLSLVN